MVESHGRDAAEGPISPGKQQRLTFWVAGTVLVIAIVLAVLIALRTPEYEAQTRLAYSPEGASAVGAATSDMPAIPPASGAATAAAAGVLSDVQMAQLIDRYDLYPGLRRKQSTAALTVKLRKNLAFSEPEPGVLQLAFRDADQAEATTVANGVASLLASYRVMSSVPMAAVPTSIKTKGKLRSTKKNSYRGQSTPPPVAAVPAPAPAVVTPPAANTAPVADVAGMTYQVERVDSALHDMQDARGELEAEQKQVASKIEVLEKTEHKSADRGGSRSEAARSERSVAEQDLAVEKAKLASLRERYTDAYPDVQTTEDDITKLQAKLATLPATPAAGEKAQPTAEQIEAMEKLRVEKQRVDRDLDQNQISTEAETQRKLTLGAQIEQAKTRRPVAPVAVVPAPAPVVVQPAAPSIPDAPEAAMMSIPVLPFRVVETAGSAALLTTSRFALAVWLGAGTALLLALCFVPMVPAHYAAVVTTPEDLKDGTPEHAVYLGDVGRTEP